MMFSKTDHAYETLRRQILDGYFKPGDRLRLSHIAQSLDLKPKQRIALAQSIGRTGLRPAQ